MNSRNWCDNLEMGLYMVIFRFLALSMGARKLLACAERMAERLGSESDEVLHESGDPRWQRAETLAERVSSWLPGTRCLHQALAARVWLARRGVDSEVVVGFHRRDELRGHAWLELDGRSSETAPRTTPRLFSRDDEAYREVFRG